MEERSVSVHANKPQKGELIKVVASDDASLIGTLWKVTGEENRKAGLHLHMQQMEMEDKPLPERRIFRWGN